MKHENNYFTEMCSGSEAGSYSRLIDFVYHSTIGLRVIKKKKIIELRNLSLNTAKDCQPEQPAVQGCLAHKKLPPPGTALGP